MHVHTLNSVGQRAPTDTLTPFPREQLLFFFVCCTPRRWGSTGGLSWFVLERPSGWMDKGSDAYPKESPVTSSGALCGLPLCCYAPYNNLKSYITQCFILWMVVERGFVSALTTSSLRDPRHAYLVSRISAAVEIVASSMREAIRDFQTKNKWPGLVLAYWGDLSVALCSFNSVDFVLPLLLPRAGGGPGSVVGLTFEFLASPP